MAWILDGSHSAAHFSVRHMMISTVRGEFTKLSGAVDFDEAKPEGSKVNIEIDVNSINSRDEKRDGHLKSPDFFDVAAHPKMTFKSTKVDVIDKNNAKLHGDLTIRGVTKPVVLDVEFNGISKAPWGSTSAGFSAKTKINRKDWGLTYNAPLETGGVLVGDEVKLEIEAELVKQ